MKEDTFKSIMIITGVICFVLSVIGSGFILLEPNHIEKNIVDCFDRNGNKISGVECEEFIDYGVEYKVMMIFLCFLSGIAGWLFIMLVTLFFHVWGEMP